MLTACGDSAESGVEKLIDEQGDGDGDVDINSDDGGFSIQTEDGSMTVEGEDGGFSGGARQRDRRWRRLPR